MVERNGRPRFCQYCGGNQESDSIHDASPRHRFNILLWTWNQNKQALVKNRHGVEVTVSKTGIPLDHDINNGKHCLKITPTQLLTEGNSIDFRCTVTNKSKDTIYIVYANVLLEYTWFSFHDPNNNNLERTIELKSKASYTAIVKFQIAETALVGSYNIPVCFSLETARRNNTFHIVRTINISVAEELSFEVDESPFKGNPWEKEVSICGSITRGRYLIPSEYKKYFICDLKEFNRMTPSDYAILGEIRVHLDPGNVTRDNYKPFWDNLLWLEETKQELGLQQYNMENVELKLLDSEWLELEVPGLAEKRPSIVKGDRVDLRLHNDLTGYRGIIKKVNDTSVVIGDLDPEFIGFLENDPALRSEIDVKFVLSRLSLERQHQGVERVVSNDLLPYLFPPDRVGYQINPGSRTISNGEFFNKIVAENAEQKTAVLKILNGSSTPYPYIIFGPPGTGKTATVVEAVLQLMRKTTHSILVCAPSNAACDVVTEKLLPYCKPSELLRILSENVDISNIHKIILPFTNYDIEEEVFRKITPEILPQYRIVVATLILVGKYSGRYRPDVVFIDEAAQACEPEVCCALGLVDKGKRIILAGDPQQLGPSLSSETAAKKYGLGITLLERLMQCDIYTRGNSNFMTMLIQNFRNHSTILDIPNRMFYDNKLQPRSAKAENDPISNIFVFSKIQELKKKNNRKGRLGHPIEFCNVISQESKEGKSPSFFNLKELQMAVKYVKALLAIEFEDADDAVRQIHIGVVTPYIRQVHKLKVLLQQEGYQDVEVGTTETFQGREKRIIIISTVRAKEDMLLEEGQFTLGFLQDRKRFNVALTRAMSKVIIIGCAQVLVTNEMWMEYIETCSNLGGFSGAPFHPRNDGVMEDIRNRIKDIKPDTQYNHPN